MLRALTALACMIAAGFAAAWWQTRNSLAELRTTNDQLNADIQKNSAAFADGKDRMKALEDELDLAHGEIESLKSVGEAKAVESRPNNDKNEDFRVVRRERSADSSEAPSDELDAIVEAKFDDTAVRHSAEQTFKREYAGLFELLNLPHDRRAQVENIITGILEEQFRDTLGRLKNGDAPDAPHTDYAQRIKDELGTVLSFDELAVYEEYEATMEDRALRQGFDTQLSIFAQDLSLENRALYLDAIAEEANAASRADGAPLDARDFMANTEILEAALARVQGSIDEEQLGVLRAYIDQQNELMNGGVVGPDGTRTVMIASPGNVRVIRQQVDTHTP